MIKEDLFQVEHRPTKISGPEEIVELCLKTTLLLCKSHENFVGIQIRKTEFLCNLCSPGTERINLFHRIPYNLCNISLVSLHSRNYFHSYCFIFHSTWNINLNFCISTLSIGNYNYVSQQEKIAITNWKYRRSQSTKQLPEKAFYFEGMVIKRKKLLQENKKFILIK